MTYKYHLLNANHSMDPYTDDIARACDRILGRVHAKMPLDGVDVVVFCNPEGIIPEIGVSGGFLKRDQVEIYIHTGLPKFARTLEQSFPSIIAHELHHWKRWKAGHFGDTLLDALVCEGLAVHFERELFPDSLPFYADILSDDQILQMEAAARPNYGDSKYDHDYWFFGSRPEYYPKWAGYSLGFHLLQRYFKRNSDKYPSSEFDKPSKSFLD